MNAKGEVVDLSTGDVVGRVIEGDAQALVGSLVTQAGQILGKDGVVLGKAAPLDSVLKPVGDVAGGVTETVGGIVGGVTGGLGSGRKGKAADGSGHDDDEGGRSPEFETTEKGKSRAGAIGMKGDDQQVTSALSPHAPSQTDGGPEGVSAEPMASKPVDMTDEKLGGAQKPAQDAVSKPTDQVGEKPGEVVEATGAPDANRGLDAGDAKNMSSASIGTKIDDKLSGVTGSKSKQELPTAGDPAERVAETAGEVVPGVSALEGLKVNKSGNVVDDDGKPLGKLVESDLAALAGKEVGKDGKIVDPESGNILGKVEPIVDKSILKGAKVNKLGNLVDENGRVVGKVAEGVDVKKVVGRRADANGDIWNDSGERIGSSNPIPENEREQQQGETKPFEAFEGATVDGKGNVVFEGEVIGKVTSGDAKRLRGMKVDADGDILDSVGNVIGTAERWEEPEPEPEPEVDTSILAGKRVNKAGNVVDGQGNIFGRVVEGDPKKLQGRMCDKKGNVLSESGDVIGRAEVVPEGEREGMKEGPFAELGACSVTRDGKVVTAGGDVVGRLVSGDAEKLFGRPVDEDGDITDRNGNVLGKAERWTEPIVEKRKGPMAGRRVNKQGEVVDEDGNVIGRLTSGDLSICLGKEVDDDGDVIDGKGNVVGHVSLLADIKEPEESPEDKEKREQLENDKKLAIRMTTCIEQCLDRIRPICKMITDVSTRPSLTHYFESSVDGVRQ